jgi:two-component system, OmpR family, sensor kinase
VTRAVRDPDQALLRSTRRILGLQTAAAITLSLLIVGTVVLLVVARTQHAAAEASLRQTAATADDVIDPPPGMWIFIQDAAGRVTGTDEAPDAFPDRAALERVRAGGPTETADRGDYLMITRRRDHAVVQVVASTHEQTAELRRLLVALGLAELAGLLLALVSTVLLVRRATAPLGEALTRQRQFVADASHELRTPLTQLHTRAQLLDRELRAGAAAADLAEDVDQMVVGTRHLGEVIEDLLLSSQLPDRPQNVTAVDLAVVGADVVAGQAARAEAQDVELTLVRDAASPSFVDGREPALRRVLTALVDNALSHTPPGGHVTVELGTESAPRRVTVVVRDDGSGFDPADAERLFARFARGHGDHRRFGLGLALAREVITGHGGTIEAWGRPGAGAAFTIHLPARDA